MSVWAVIFSCSTLFSNLVKAWIRALIELCPFFLESTALASDSDLLGSSKSLRYSKSGPGSESESESESIVKRLKRLKILKKGKNWQPLFSTSQLRQRTPMRPCTYKGLEPCNYSGSFTKIQGNLLKSCMLMPQRAYRAFQAPIGLR
jgi:hypothetical protein